MSQHVVISLEMVDIDHEQGQRTLIALGAADLFAVALVEITAIKNLGQAVHIGQFTGVEEQQNLAQVQGDESAGFPQQRHFGDRKGGGTLPEQGEKAQHAALFRAERYDQERTVQCAVFPGCDVFDVMIFVRILG